MSGGGWTVDWRWRHGPVSGPLHAAVALAAAWQVGTLPAVEVSPEWVLGGGAVAAGVTALRSRQEGLSRLRVGYRLAAVGGGSVWLAQAVADGWSGALGWTLAGGAVTAGLLWRPMRAREERAVERHAAQVEAARAAAVDAAEQERLHGVADVWAWRLEQVCRIPGCRVLGIEDWWFPGPDGQPRRTGYTLEVLLPTTGETWQTVAMFGDGLAAAADLPEGCGVEVGPGASRRRCMIEVSTHDALRDDIPLAVPDRPCTAADPLALGVLRTGAAAQVPLLYESMVLTGAKRSGKSNQLQTLIAGMLSCSDRLVLVIDYNGGGVALPWLAPWVDGTIGDSPILWVADNETEANIMCDWLIAQIEHRKRAYYAQNTARNDDKIFPSPQVPQLMLVTDEFGALSREVRGKISQISDRGGAAAVGTLSCALRAVAEYVPTELLAQAQVRAAMRVNDVKELGYLFEQRRGVAAEDAPHTGYGHYRVGQEPPRVFKGFRTSPETIRRVAVAQAAWRPPLDEVSASMSAEWRRVFESRWERSAHLLAAAGGGTGAPVPAGAGGSGPGSGTGGATGPAGTGSTGTGSTGTGPSGTGGRTGSGGPGAAGTGSGGAAGTGPSGTGGFGDALDALNAAADRLRNTAPDRDGGPAGRDGGPDADAAFAALAAEVVVPELLARILAAMGEADRMHTAQIAAAIGARKETLGRLLSQVGIRPLPNDFSVSGRRGRGYRRADVEAAMDAILAGDLVPPDAVMAWQPEPGQQE